MPYEILLILLGRNLLIGSSTSKQRYLTLAAFNNGKLQHYQFRYIISSIKYRLYSHHTLIALSLLDGRVWGFLLSDGHPILCLLLQQHRKDLEQTPVVKQNSRAIQYQCVEEAISRDFVTILVILVVFVLSQFEEQLC